MNNSFFMFQNGRLTHFEIPSCLETAMSRETLRKMPNNVQRTNRYCLVLGAWDL